MLRVRVVQYISPALYIEFSLPLYFRNNRDVVESDRYKLKAAQRRLYWATTQVAIMSAILEPSSLKIFEHSYYVGSYLSGILYGMNYSKIPI